MVRMIAIIFTLFLMAGCSEPRDLGKMTFAGTLEMTEHVLGAKMPGRVTSVTVKEGDMVQKGQVLATLERYAQALKDHKRTEELFKTGGANAQAVEYAQLALEDQSVISPIDGIVLVKAAAEAGEIVAAGMGIVVVGDVKDKWVKVFVPEGVVNQIVMDQSAEITLDGLKDTYKGHVSFIATKAEFTPRNVQTKEERVTQAFAVKVTFDEPSASLHAGVAADVRFKP
jgi:multidrug efflux pump subunit AcrA (membrane-fusion protein)